MPVHSLQLDASLALAYKSLSQRARVMSETWMLQNLDCPACGRSLSPYENNRKVADAFCPACQLDFELKCKKSSIAKQVPDGAYSSMIERITSDSAPSFFFMQYDDALKIRNLFVTPAHFITEQLIARRKRLSENARRASWEGCSILTSLIPESGRIFYVSEGQVRPIEDVCAQYSRTAFLAKQSRPLRGWLLDVMTCIEDNFPHSATFSLSELYRFVPRFAALHPDNNNIEAKIRQQLQLLRDLDYLEFLPIRGTYRLKM